MYIKSQCVLIYTNSHRGSCLVFSDIYGGISQQDVAASCSSNTSLHAADQWRSSFLHFCHHSSLFIVDKRLSILARFLANSDDVG